jgi:ATP-dependent RNA helicase DeaD
MASEDFAPETAPDTAPAPATSSADDSATPAARASAPRADLPAPAAGDADASAVATVDPDVRAADADATDEGVADPSDPDADSSAENVFAALGLRRELCDALAALGYEEPTPIQREAIPVLLEGRDVLGVAATGTGKTAAFALPLIQRIIDDAPARRTGAAPRALVLVPTRELCMQVAEAIHKYGRGFGTRVLAVYGGAAMGQQLRALDRGVDVVVATPGRALDHVNRGTLKLDEVRVLVLDEADEMLDMGFEEDLTAIVGATPAERQSALFSATMAPRVARIASSYLREPARVEVARRELAEGEMPRVRSTVYLVPRAHKTAALGRVLDMEAPTSAIVFCRTRNEADELTETLAARGFGAEALHGGMGQEARDRVMRRFRGGQLELLIATDVAARGLDVEHVSHVVNYDVPSAPDAYVHRVGRTGRAGREGVAITIAEPRERGLLRNIERVTRQKLEVAPVPTPAELQSRRSERTAEAVRAMLEDARREPTAHGDGPTRDDAAAADGLGAFRAVAEVLSAEYDLLDVTAAALRLAHEADAGAVSADETEIPSLHQREGEGRGDPRRGRPDDRERGGRFERGARSERPERSESFDRGARFDRGERPERGERPGRGDRPDRGERPARTPGRAGAGGDTVRLFVGVGRRSGLRPADLVGAIVNEAGIDPSDIGAIDIGDGFSLVEVPGSSADGVIDALRATTIRGERPMVRHERESGGERGGERGGRPAGGGEGEFRGRSFERAPERSFDRPRPDRGGAGDREFGGGRPAGRSFERGEREERPARGGFGGRERPGERGGRGDRPFGGRGGGSGGGGRGGFGPRRGRD